MKAIKDWAGSDLGNSTDTGRSWLTRHVVSPRFFRTSHKRWKQLWYNGWSQKVEILNIKVHKHWLCWI